MWKTTLEKTEELGKGRSTVADMLQDTISESLKDLKRRKEQQFKKHFEVAQRMISEVLDTVKDLSTVSWHIDAVCYESWQIIPLVSCLFVGFGG